MQKKNNCHMLELYKNALDRNVLKAGDILNFNIDQDEKSIQNKNLEHFLNILKEMTDIADQKDILVTFILNNYNFVMIPLNKVKNEKLQNNIKNLSAAFNKSSDNRLYWGKID